MLEERNTVDPAQIGFTARLDPTTGRIFMKLQERFLRHDEEIQNRERYRPGRDDDAAEPSAFIDPTFSSSNIWRIITLTSDAQKPHIDFHMKIHRSALNTFHTKTRQRIRVTDASLVRINRFWDDDITSRHEFTASESEPSVTSSIDTPSY
ncbi:hypothetical protein F2P81_016384 [Scophthalmus maximus]|uniref:Uncharacterized protein n=1 Tax=Scophthalmus maximus TaxID=52904 RepID=A0A6A4SH41_SCOMX|nr:hypothetical protein F2P81_016384 [Scophthalmus maximus]